MDAERIREQYELLEQYRSNLRHLLLQAARHGGDLDAPLFVINQIKTSRIYVKAMKAWLRKLDELVEDNPEDDEIFLSEPSTISNHSFSQKIADVLSKVQDTTLSLSVGLIEALRLARESGNENIIAFCEQELAGYKDGYPGLEKIEHRLASGYASLNQIDLRRSLGHIDDIISFMAESQHFINTAVPIYQSVASLEKTVAEKEKNTLIVLPFRIGDMWPGTDNPEQTAYWYANPEIFGKLLESIRARLTRLILDM